jgi:glycosyltransferase involved in cell wall biosynthesis
MKVIHEKPHDIGVGQKSSGPEFGRDLEVAMQEQSLKQVVIFRKDLLPLSEIFIRDQFLSYESWTPHLAGYHFCNELDMEDTPAFVLEGFCPRAFRWLYLKAHQHLQYVGIFPLALKRYVENINPQIIHAHFGYDAILIYDLAKALKIPLVVTLHGTDILNSPEAWKSGSAGHFFRCYPRKLEKLCRDKNVFFIAVSRALRERALARGVPADRCVVRYTGTSDQYFSPSFPTTANRNTVLFVGRLVEFKGCEFLIRAISIVQKQVLNAELVVIGDGPLKPQLISMSNELGIKASFLGAIPRNQVKEWMTKSRVFCLPSITDNDESFEAFGMVILEAQFSGLPVITSARGGSESIIHNKTGFVFPERDYETLAKYIMVLLTDDDLRGRFANEARQHVLANFTLDACTSRIEEYYDEILQLQPRSEIR